MQGGLGCKLWVSRAGGVRRDPFLCLARIKSERRAFLTSEEGTRVSNINPVLRLPTRQLASAATTVRLFAGPQMRVEVPTA